MGTRNLTMIVLGEEIKVAQYGQFDGYPSGQGLTALEFLKTHDLDKFKEKVRCLNWLSHEDLVEINNTTNWAKEYPWLSREAGADILEYIYSGEAINFKDNRDFAADSLFCEWCYVIDLDKGVFEVYEGFNSEPLNKNERFYSIQREDTKYYPVKHVKTYNLNELPDGGTFVNECDPPEED